MNSQDNHRNSDTIQIFFKFKFKSEDNHRNSNENRGIGSATVGIIGNLWDFRRNQRTSQENRRNHQENQRTSEENHGNSEGDHSNHGKAMRFLHVGAVGEFFCRIAVWIAFHVGRRGEYSS